MAEKEGFGTLAFRWFKSLIYLSKNWDPIRPDGVPIFGGEGGI